MAQRKWEVTQSQQVSYSEQVSQCLGLVGRGADFVRICRIINAGRESQTPTCSRNQQLPVNPGEAESHIPCTTRVRLCKRSF